MAGSSSGFIRPCNMSFSVSTRYCPSRKPQWYIPRSRKKQREKKKKRVPTCSNIQDDSSFEKWVRMSFHPLFSPQKWHQVFLRSNGSQWCPETTGCLPLGWVSCPSSRGDLLPPQGTWVPAVGWLLVGLLEDQKPNGNWMK